MKYSGFASFGWKNFGLFVCFWGGKRASATGLRKTKKTRRKPKKTKKQKKQKNQSLGRNGIPKDFLQGIVFLVFFGYFVFLEGNGYRAEKNQKNSKKTKKNKKNKKTKVWGEMLYPKISSRGLFFLVILFFFDIFLLLGSWFCEAYVGLKNQNHHFGAGQKPKPPHFNWKDPV